MGHQLVLLSPYTYPGPYPLTLAEDDMAAWLNGYTALWHPALLWQAAEPPRVETPYDHENPKPAMIYVVPETPPNYLPENWRERVQQAGSIAISATVDRTQTLENIRSALGAADAPPLGWEEALEAPPDMLHMCFGLGLGYLLQATLAEAMEHENLLEKTVFWGEVQKSVEAMGNEEGSAPMTTPPPSEGSPAPTEDVWLTHLRQAAQKLLSAREVLYPVTIHWLDLHVFGDAPFGDRWPAALEWGIAANLIIAAEALEKFATQHPEKLATLKALVERDLVEICGGSYQERSETLLPYDSQRWNLHEGLGAVQRLLGKDIAVYARRRFGFHPRTVQLLAAHGVTKLLFLLFDDTAGIPSFTSPVIAWTAPDGKQIDAFVRVPKPAEKAETYFNLGNTWFKTTREDHHAIVCLAHTGSAERPWHRDLIALSRLAPVLGTWTTFSQYLAQVSLANTQPRLSRTTFITTDLANEPTLIYPIP